MARRIFFKEQESLGVAPNGYSIMGFNSSSRAIKTDESGVVKLIESVYTDENNTIVIGASGGTGSVSVNGYYELPNYAPTPGKVLGLSGSSLHWITAGGGGGLSGEGTTNYLAKWNASSLTGSLVYDNGTNVGIGTASPSYPLHIKNTVSNVLGLYRNSIDGNGPVIAFNSNGSYGTETEFVRIAGVGVNTNGVFFIETKLGGTDQASLIYREQTTSANGGGLRIQNSGMSTTAQANAVLDVRTTFNDANNLALFYNNTSSLVHLFMNNGNVYLNYNNTGKTVVGSYIASPSAQLTVVGSGTSSSTHALKVENSVSGRLLYVRDDGFVGIGTNPAYMYGKLTIESSTTSDGIFLTKDGDTNAVLGYQTIASGGYGGYLKLNSGANTYVDVVRLNTGTYDYISTGRNMAIGTTDGSQGKFSVQGSIVHLNSGVAGLQGNYQVIISSGSDGGYIVADRIETSQSPVAKFRFNYGTYDFVNTGKNFGVGLISPSSTLHVKSVSNVSTDYALKVDNFSGSPLLYVRNDQSVTVRNPTNVLAPLNVGAYNGYITAIFEVDNNGRGIVICDNTALLGGNGWQINAKNGSTTINTISSSSNVNAGTLSNAQLKTTGLIISSVLNDTPTQMLSVRGDIDVIGGAYRVSNVSGVSGTFTSQDGKTITVSGGIITSIV